MASVLTSSSHLCCSALLLPLTLLFCTLALLFDDAMEGPSPSVRGHRVLAARQHARAIEVPHAFDQSLVLRQQLLARAPRVGGLALRETQPVLHLVALPLEPA